MIEDSGYTVIPEEDRYKNIVEIFKQYYPNISENPANIAMILARVFARDANLLDYELATAHNNAYIAHAVGANLDRAVRTAGMWRLSGTQASGDIRIEKLDNVAQLIIPANFVIESDGLKYVTQNTSAIIQNTQYLDLQVKSYGVGTIYNIQENSKFNAYESTYGIKEIIATSKISGATDRETDSELRIRYMDRMEATTTSALSGIIDYVGLTDGVTRVDGRQNTSDDTVDGLPPHSYEIFVKGGTYLDIGTAIAKIGPAGIKSVGDISVDIAINKTNTETISFSRFDANNVYYYVEVAISPTVSQTNVISEVKNKLIEYTLDSSKIVGYEVSNYLSQQIDGINGIKTLFFSLSENPTTNDDITATVGKLLFTEEADINVVAV